jgi:hypothetical protein
LVFKDVHADSAGGTDVGVVHLGGECELRGPERVFEGDSNFKAEEPSGIGAVLRPKERSL